MTEKNRDIYKRLLKAYYIKDNFKEVVKDILDKEFDDINIGKETLMSLCGVKITDSTNDFIYDLAKAITNNEVCDHVMKKINNCTHTCEIDSNKSKCISVCPFDAITIDPILNDKVINQERCIGCGKCMSVCTSHNYIDVHEGIPVLELIKSKKPVIACVAPAIAGQFGKNVSIDQLRTAFIKMGFADMVEVSFGADILTIIEAVEFNEFVSNKDDLMITSCCCPVWIGIIRKNYHEFVKYTSPTVSPMIATGRVLKKINPDCINVFIGPCIAKKKEAKDEGISDAIDYVLTFDELEDIFETLNVNPAFEKPTPSMTYSARGGKLYPASGGICEAISDMVKEMYPNKYELFKSVNVSGGKACKDLLEKIKKRDIKETFVEGLACDGGCVGGPKVLIPKEEGKKSVKQEAYSSPIKVIVHSEIADEVLNRIGINKIEDFKDHDKVAIFHRTLLTH